MENNNEKKVMETKEFPKADKKLSFEAKAAAQNWRLANEYEQYLKFIKAPVDKIRTASRPRVHMTVNVLKRGENWLFVKQTSEYYNPGIEETAKFIINISPARFEGSHERIEVGQTYYVLLDIVPFIDEKNENKPEIKYWLAHFKEAEFNWN